ASSTGHISAAFGITLNGPDGKMIGAIAMRVTPEEINRILVADRTGLGETGESYLIVDKLILSDQVSSKNLMSTPSRFVDNSVLKVEIDTEGSRRALSHESGSSIYANYRTGSVLGYYTWVPELNSALLTEIDTEEAFAAVARLRLTIIGVVAGAFLL